MIQVQQYTAGDLNRAKELVSHLFENPSIKNEPPLIGERLIINFIEKNLQELSVVFQFPGFFPNLELTEAVNLILADMYNRVYASSLPPIINFLDNTDLSFFNRLSDTGVVDDMHRRIKLHEFVLRLFGDRDVRYMMYPVIAVFRYNAVDRYISEIFNRREYIYKEITCTEKIKTETGIYISLVKVILLLRNIVYFKMDKLHEDISVSKAFRDAETENGSFKESAGIFVRAALSMLPGIPSEIIRIAVESHPPAVKSDSGDSLAKLVYILCSIFQYYRENEKPCRGSESPEKSWLGIAKHNCDYAGFDRGMIESLYLIAEDNNW